MTYINQKKRIRPNDNNVIAFGKEAIKAYHEKRLPNYDINNLNNPNRSIYIPPQDPVSYINDDFKNININEPLLGPKCLCLIL